jgi:hypothetical protein
MLLLLSQRRWTGMLDEKRASFLWLLLRVCERRDRTTKGILGYTLGYYILIGQLNVDQHCFQAGDVFEVRMGAEWQAVRMESGGYKGWYLVTADGQWVRPALSMKARLADTEQKGQA